ncbi:type III-A CRISPR-associated protein Csm2 [Myroides sp. DF42-4-2]|uniref:type III-A CRISPR-associated protein Csm2 n=1 Tax=Myroides sp. DF42-4-2 TaxID=2746726 RepID=UPI00257503C5|nr:type III-A CRISPR-associated protein Csm2 [Myroides sp. DF42-4-2]MDM1406641.1 type III-A CRISPR-associated protein Csm2 [Myroides sp. DF42-4-2]
MTRENNKKEKKYYSKERVNPFDDKNLLILNRKNDTSEYQKFLLDGLDTLVQTKLKSISKTQMRNIFDLIKSCDTVEQMNMIKPKLMYTAGRLTGIGKEYLLHLSKVAFEVKNDAELDAVKKYIETVLAYHKYYAVK